ncbi:MAG: hypothetical protein ACQETI_05800 [Halobacteriota archaeon]
MVAAFTDRQIGKRVVAQNGVEIGEVADVRNGSLYVSIGPDVDRDVTSELRWGGAVNQSMNKLQDTFIADITEDVVRLNV